MRNAEIYYDSGKRCLVFCRERATDAFWDEHWSSASFREFIQARNRFVNYWTKKYMLRSAKLVEGGCGRGQNVWSLKQDDYEVVGVDYARRTLQLIKLYIPGLDIVAGDVRALPSKDASFDGYWSLGVIEHFYEGFESVIAEAYRVLKRGGVLFLTFPQMSPLRRFKALFNFYEKLPVNFVPEADRFFQFALRKEQVLSYLEDVGFSIIKTRGYDAVKGLKDEVMILRTALQKVYDSSKMPAMAIKKLVDLTGRQLAGHMAFVIAKKER